MIFELEKGLDGKYTELIKQIKTYLPVSLVFDAHLMVGFINKAIQLHIYPTISREFYNELDANTANYPAELPDMIKRSVFNIAFASYASIGNIQISNVGFTEAQTDTQKPARLEAIHNFKTETMNTGIMQLDEILYFIETQLAIEEEASKYLIYANSFEVEKRNELLIKTATEFNKYFPINQSRMVFGSVVQELKSIQFLKIKPLLHGVFDILNNGTPAVEILLEQFIKPAMAHLAIGGSVMKLTAILGLHNTISIFDNTSNNYAKTHKTAPQDLLDAYKQEVLAKGNEYLAQMIGYIKSNPELYPDYPVDDTFIEDDLHTSLHNHDRIFVL